MTVKSSLTQELLELVKSKFSEDVNELIMNKRLLVADYSELSSALGPFLTNEGHYIEGDSIFYAPIVLFYRCEWKFAAST